MVIQPSKNIFYLYLESTIGLAIGYAFWLVISKISGPDVIGLVSAMASFATVLISIVTLGIPTGVQRFLGIATSQNDKDSFKSFTMVSLLLVSCNVTIVSLIVFLLSSQITNLLNLPLELLLLAVTTMIASGVSIIFRPPLIASLKAKYLLLSQTVAAASRLGIGTLLVIIGLGAVGVAIGYSILYIVSGLISGFFVFHMIRQTKGPIDNGFTKTKEILKASTANWVPNIITILGIHLGVLAVFGLQGAAQAGVYYIAFAIFSAIAAIPSSITGIVYPLLSGMQDGRKTLTWRAIRLGLVLSMPVTASIMLYPEQTLGFLSKEYQSGSMILTILLASMLPIIVSSGISSLAYAHGKYSYVIAIGLAGSVPRVILYFILVGSMAGLGAAYAFVVGSFAMLFISFIFAKMMKLCIVKKDIIAIPSIPLAIAYATNAVGMHYSLAWFLTVSLSLLCYLKLRLLTEQDLRDVLFGVLPAKTAETSYQKLRGLIHMIGIYK